MRCTPMNNLLKRLNSTGRSSCFTYPLSGMALSEWDFMSDDDPWKVSAFVSAIVELFLSILLLLGAAIAFITSRFAKFFGLEPPCTYIGCSHSLHSESFKGQRLPTPPSCKSKDLCIGEFCPDCCHPLRIHSDCGSNQEEGSCSEGSRKRSSFGSRDCNATEQDLDVSSGHLAFSGRHHEMRCSCSDGPLYKRRNRRKGPNRMSFVYAASSSKLNKDDLPLLSAKSGSESSGGFDAEDHGEISQVAADSEEDWAYTKKDSVIDGDASLAHDSEALKRNVALEDLDQRLHCISPSFSESNQAESAEVLPCYAVHDEVERPKDKLDKLADLEKQWPSQCSEKVDDDNCLEKGPVAAYLSSVELSSQEAIMEGLQESSLEGAYAPCEKDGRLSGGENVHCGVIETHCDLKQGELSMNDPGKGVKGVFDDTIATDNLPNESTSTNAMNNPGKGVKGVFDDAIATDDLPDESTSTNAMAQWGRSSRALSVSPLEGDEEEEEFAPEEGQEEGLDALKVALQAERSVLAALETELENERNAAAVATSEAMAMISRLQEEKSAMQMEVAQLQRMSEEKADYDEQAMALLKEILFKREKENIALEKEVELYRETLSAEKADELKRNWHSEGTGSPSPQSLKPLLLTGGEEEFLSPIDGVNQKHGFAFSEKFYRSGTRSAPWIPESRRSLDFEELNAFSLDQNVNKRSTDSPMSDTAVSMFSRVWNDEGRPRYHADGGLHGPYHADGGLHGPHNNSEQLKKMGRSVSLTNDEETQLILERLWVLEEELQELRGKDSVGSQKAWSKPHGVEQSAISPTNRRADKSLADSWVGQGINSKEQREGVEMDGLPIHDVYEVHSASNSSPPFAEERDPPEGSEGISGNAELPPGSFSESFSPARMARHRIQIPPRTLQARKSYPSDEAPCTPDFTPQPAGWIVGKRSHPEELWDHQDLQTQALVSRDERRMVTEQIQQLAVRLKALEEDRELLRETLESFKHRDAELNLLQEIAQHLRELRMGGFMRGFLSEEVSVTSPSKSRALKKRRYCSGPGQAQIFPLQQKSI